MCSNLILIIVKIIVIVHIKLNLESWILTPSWTTDFKPCSNRFFSLHKRLLQEYQYIIDSLVENWYEPFLRFSNTKKKFLGEGRGRGGKECHHRHKKIAGKIPKIREKIEYSGKDNQIEYTLIL